MVCIHNLTFRVTRAESLLVHLFLLVCKAKKSAKIYILSNTWTKGVKSTNTLEYIYFLVCEYVRLGITAKC